MVLRDIVERLRPIAADLRLMVDGQHDQQRTNSDMTIRFVAETILIGALLEAFEAVIDYNDH